MDISIQKEKTWIFSFFSQKLVVQIIYIFIKNVNISTEVPL